MAEVVPEALPESAKYILVSCPGSRCLSLKGAPGTKSYDKTCCDTCFGISVVPADYTPNPEWENALRYMRRPFSSREKKSISWGVETTTMQAMVQVWAKRRERALARLRRGTTENRTSIKARIWQRGGGKCAICDLDLDEHPKLATLGHRVDQVCGGSDADINLDLQCRQCNSQIKPLHETLEAYFAWLAECRGEPEPEPVGEKREGWLARLWQGMTRRAS